MELIDYIEDQDYEINIDNYLHAFTYEHNHLITMLNEGIKAPILLEKKIEGSFNGSYYVSLMKYEDCDHNVYEKLANNPMFVIKGDIKTIYANFFVHIFHLGVVHMKMNIKNFLLLKPKISNSFK